MTKEEEELLLKEGKMLPVMEHFYTIQGEGFHQGKAAYFIRLGGCDVGCVWCDVKESWDANLHPKFTVEQIVEKAIKEVNKRLDGATGPQAGLLHDLKDSLERLAEVNFNKIDPKLANEYNDWKKQYSSFATIRDISQRAGKEGITAAGQINPQLFDLEPGECFGELPLIDDEPYAATAMAENESVIIKFAFDIWLVNSIWLQGCFKITEFTFINDCFTLFCKSGFI